MKSFMTYLILACILLMSSAFATKKPPAPLIKIFPDQEQAQKQNQKQAQDQKQVQDQLQTQSLVSEQANEQHVTFTSYRQAMSAIAPNVASNNPCFTSASAAIGLPKVNIGGGKQKRDLNCEKLETARMLGSLGEMELAIQMACATDAAIEVLGDACRSSINVKDELANLRKTLDNEREECAVGMHRAFETCVSK